MPARRHALSCAPWTPCLKFSTGAGPPIPPAFVDHAKNEGAEIDSASSNALAAGAPGKLETIWPGENSTQTIFWEVFRAGRQNRDQERIFGLRLDRPTTPSKRSLY